MPATAELSRITWCRQCARSPDSFHSLLISFPNLVSYQPPPPALGLKRSTKVVTAAAFCGVMTKDSPRPLRFITCGTSAGKRQNIILLPLLTVGCGCKQVFALERKRGQNGVRPTQPNTPPPHGTHAASPAPRRG